nr:MAG TPA: hypothetical protein [Caudoviricetes sp.]
MEILAFLVLLFPYTIMNYRISISYWLYFITHIPNIL